MAKPKNTQQKKYPLGLLIPIIAVMAIIPMITFMHTYDTNLTQFDWYTSYTKAVDFFLYHKMIWLNVASGCMIFALIYMIFADEQKAVWIKALIPLAIYCVLTFISAICSEYKYFSFHGVYEQFESVWTLMGYCLIVYYCFFVLRSESAVRRVLNWFVVGICIMTALGLSQVFYHDFFRTSFGQKLMTPSSYTGGALTFNFESGRPYLTLYNPNYVGFYVSLVVPILVALIFATKKLWQRILYAFLIVSLLLILFASQSRAGIISIIFSLFVMLLCMRKVFMKNWKITVAAIAVFIVAFIGINVMNQGILINRMKSMFSTADEYHALKSILTQDDHVSITYNEDILNIYVSQDASGNDMFAIYDADNNPIDSVLLEDGYTLSITDSRFPFSYGSVRSEDFSGFFVTIEDKTWYFSNLMKQGDTTFYAMGGNGSLMKLTEQKKSLEFLENHYHFANMRGYIWARTLPLLKDYFWLGSGPDTFIIAFPNNDLVGLHTSGHVNEIITKPHCMYLQIAVQTGVPSLIALLVFLGWYLISSLRIYWKHNYEGFLPKVGVAIFVSIISYLILALTNDSCVAVAPIFYALVGMGLGINYKLKKDATT